MMIRSSVSLLLLAACGQSRQVAHAGETNSVRATPIRIEQRRERLVEVDSEAWQQVVSTFEPRILRRGSPYASPSICLHCVRLRGMEATYADELVGQSSEVLAAILDADLGKRVFHYPIATKTRFGARFRPPSMLPQSAIGADESHIDQVLAGLLELGVPLDSVLNLGTSQVAVRDVVADTIANFSIRQPEIGR